MKKLSSLERKVIGGVAGAGLALGAASADAANTLHWTYNDLKSDTYTAVCSTVDPTGLPSDVANLINYEVIAQGTHLSAEQPDGGFAKVIYLDDNEIEQHVQIYSTRNGVDGPMSAVASRILNDPIGDNDSPKTRYLGRDGNGGYVFEASEAFCIDNDKRVFYEPVDGIATVPEDKFTGGTHQFSKLDISDQNGNDASLIYPTSTFTGNVADYVFDTNKRTTGIVLGEGLEGFVEASFPFTTEALPSRLAGAEAGRYIIGVPLSANGDISNVIININDGVADLSYHIADVRDGKNLFALDLANDVAAGNIATFNWNNVQSYTANIPDDDTASYVELGEVFYTNSVGGILTKDLVGGKYVTGVDEVDNSVTLSGKLPPRVRDYNPEAIAYNNTDEVIGTGFVPGAIDLTADEYLRMNDTGITHVFYQGAEELHVNTDKSKLEEGYNVFDRSMGKITHQSEGFVLGGTCDSREIRSYFDLSGRTELTLGEIETYAGIVDE